MSRSNLAVWTARTKFGEKGLTKSNISDIFYQLAVNDDDFNGSNGEQYLWEGAKKGGFESNCDYLGHLLLKDITDDKILGYGEVKALIDKFLVGWTCYDSYYNGMDFTFEDENNVLFVAVAVMYGG